MNKQLFSFLGGMKQYEQHTAILSFLGVMKQILQLLSFLGVMKQYEQQLF